MDGQVQKELRRTILALEGYKPTRDSTSELVNLGAINCAFTDNQFPLGFTHEFQSSSPEDMAATSGFLSVILSSLMRTGGISFWISSGRTLFPPALAAFGIAPEKFIFIDVKKDKDILWVMEEALKCKSLTAVVGEVRNISFNDSRRLQLAVESSRVTGFIIRRASENRHPLACHSRWKISHLPSWIDDGMPGVGYPRWNIELLKVRHGQPSSFQVEWDGNRLRTIPKTSLPIQHLKVG